MNAKGKEFFIKKLRRCKSKLPDVDFSRLYHWSDPIFEYEDADLISEAINFVRDIRRPIKGNTPYLNDLIYILTGQASKISKWELVEIRKNRVTGIKGYPLRNRVPPTYVDVLKLINYLLRLSDVELNDKNYYLNYGISMAKSLRDNQCAVATEGWEFIHDNYSSLLKDTIPLIKELDELEIQEGLSNG